MSDNPQGEYKCILLAMTGYVSAIRTEYIIFAIAVMILPIVYLLPWPGAAPALLYLLFWCLLSFRVKSYIMTKCRDDREIYRKAQWKSAEEKNDTSQTGPKQKGMEGSEEVVSQIRSSFLDDVGYKHSEGDFPDLEWADHRRKHYRGHNWTISANVYHRLCMRHATLLEMEKLETKYKIHDVYKDIARLKREKELPRQCHVKGADECGGGHGGIPGQPAGGPNGDTAQDRNGGAQPTSEPRNNGDDSLAEKGYTALALRRAYHLATTDLFVEKAIAYLEEDYNKYMDRGAAMYRLAFIPLIVGATMSLLFTIGPDTVERNLGYMFHVGSAGDNANGDSSNKSSSPGLLAWAFEMLGGLKQEDHQHNNSSNKKLGPLEQVFENLRVISIGKENEYRQVDAALMTGMIEAGGQDAWRQSVEGFARGFTFFGFLAMLSVACWRYGKAMLDQAERLRERRHALRQGRLFVHLKDGELTIEELERAFSWNVSRGNAFGNMQTEASAPWGAIFKDALTYLAGILPKPKPADGSGSKP